MTTQSRSAPRRFAVIGLGILGNSIALTLAGEGAEVIVLDKSQKLIDSIKDQVSVAVQCDTTDRETLVQLGIPSVDAAMVCIGEDFQSAVLTVANLIELNVKRVAVRATNPMSASIMKRLGAHDVFFVESEMGIEIAHKLIRPTILQEMSLGGDYRIIELAAPQGFHNKTLSELELPKKFGVQVVAVRSPVPGNESPIRVPMADTRIQSGDLLLLCGHDRDLSRVLLG
jgi:trk system potassium uptake protein TrkA